MVVSNADIQALINQNQGTSEQTIANAMQQYGVSPAQTQAQSPAMQTNYLLSSLPENGLNPAFGLDGMNVKKFMDATGASFEDATNMLYGNVGSNKDYRNWDAIMSSSDPLQAAKDATTQLYGGGYNVNYLYDPQQDNYTTSIYSKDGVNLTSIGGGKTLADAQDSSKWSGYQRFGITNPSQLPNGGSVYNYDPKTYNPYMNRTQDSPYMNLTSSNPNFQAPQQTLQQQAPASYVSNAFPQYTPNYTSLTQDSYAPQQTNALMRPITPNSSLTQQQQYQNIGYNTNRSSLWGDW
jgi:hypothetical protein